MKIFSILIIMAICVLGTYAMEGASGLSVEAAEGSSLKTALDEAVRLYDRKNEAKRTESYPPLAEQFTQHIVDQLKKEKLFEAFFALRLMDDKNEEGPFTVAGQRLSPAELEHEYRKAYTILIGGGTWADVEAKYIEEYQNHPPTVDESGTWAADEAKFIKEYTKSHPRTG